MSRRITTVASGLLAIALVAALALPATTATGAGRSRAQSSDARHAEVQTAIHERHGFRRHLAQSDANAPPTPGPDAEPPAPLVRLRPRPPSPQRRPPAPPTPGPPPPGPPDSGAGVPGNNAPLAPPLAPASPVGAGDAASLKTPQQAALDKDIIIGVAQMELDVENWWNFTSAMNKACKFIHEAGRQNVSLLTFPEGTIAGYPWFNWWTSTFEMDANELIQELFVLGSPRIGTSDLDPLLQCIKEAGVNVVMPMNERDNEGSQTAVFNSAIFIDKYGKVVGRHRKIMPSFTERFWWSLGDGSDLIVVDMPGVGRVCSLSCWENYVVLERYVMYAQGCEFLMAPTQDIGPVWAAHMKSIAREGRMYVVSGGQFFKPSSVASSNLALQSKAAGSGWVDLMLKHLNMAGDNPNAQGGYLMDGGAIIANPDGQSLVGPVYSACSFCEPTGGIPKYGVQWAKAGCPGIDSQVYHTYGNCTVLTVPGVGEAELILTAHVNRGTVLRKKTYQDNVGNYMSKNIFQVTWYNRAGNYLITQPNGTFTPVSTPGSVGNGLNPIDG